GDGSLRDRLTAEGQRLIPGRLRWLGRLPAGDMPRHYQAADLTLLSSNRESAARVLYESLLAGTPVLTTDTAGAREVVEDNGTGRIVPIGDGCAFAQALCELCGDPGRLRVMGEAGRRRMRGMVTAEPVARQLRQVYDTALAIAR